MSKRTIMVAFFAMFLALWLIYFPSGVWRYRVTLEVETPEGLKTGSSVVEVYGNQSFGALLPLPGTSVEIKTWGEAVVVDLGQRGALYGLLRSEASEGNHYGIVWAAFPLPDKKRGARGRHGIRYYSSLEGIADIPAKAMPMLVRFRDEKDPNTVEKVDRANLAASFGEGVALKRATIEMVPAGWWPLNRFGIGGEPVTTGIEKRLGWLATMRRGGLDGSLLHHHGKNATLANALHRGHFLMR